MVDIWKTVDKITCFFGVDEPCKRLAFEAKDKRWKRYKTAIDGIQKDIYTTAHSPWLPFDVALSVFNLKPRPFSPDGKITTLEEKSAWRDFSDDHPITASSNFKFVGRLHPLYDLRYFTSACDHEFSRCSPGMKFAHDYIRQEVAAAEMLGKAELEVDYSDIGYLEGLKDKRSDPNFRRFMLSLSSIPPTLLDNIHGTIVDWVVGEADDPVIFVWLDAHTETAQQSTLINDWIRLQSYDPLVTTEGTNVGERVAKRSLQVGMSVYGYEDEAALDEQRFAINNNVGDMTDQSFILIYRSQRAIENTIDLMEQHDKKIGLMRMGKAHYPSLQNYAASTRKANVIFIRLDNK